MSNDPKLPTFYLDKASACIKLGRRHKREHLHCYANSYRREKSSNFSIGNRVCFNNDENEKYWYTKTLHCLLVYFAKPQYDHKNTFFSFFHCSPLGVLSVIVDKECRRRGSLIDGIRDIYKASLKLMLFFVIDLF